MSQGDAPAGRMAHRILAILGLLLLAAVIAAVVFRETLAQRAAITWLEDQGIAVHNLDVTRLTTGGIQARNIALGADREVGVQELTVAFAWDGLQPRIAEATAAGLRLTLDITGDAPLLGSLQPVATRWTTGTGGAAEAPMAQPQEGSGEGQDLQLPPVSLADARVTLRTPSGPMTAELTGTLDPDGSGGMEADARLNLDSELGRLRAAVTAAQSASGDLRLSAELSEGRLAWRGFAVGSFGGNLEIARPDGGRPRLDADLDLKQLAYTPAAGAPLRLEKGTLTAAGTTQEAEISLSLQGEAERLSLEVAAHQGAPGTESPAGLTINGELHTAGGFAQFLPLPGPAVTAATVILEAESSGRPSRDLTDPASWRDLSALLAESPLQLRGDAILAEVTLADGTQGISAHLPLAADLATDRLALTLREDAAVRVEQPAGESLRGLGVPDDLLPLVASGLNLTLAAGGERPFRIVSTPAWPPERAEIAVAATAGSGQGLTLRTEIAGTATLGTALALERFGGSVTTTAEAARISFGGREARGVTLTLPLTANYEGSSLNLALHTPGALTIDQFGASAPLRLEDPLHFAIDQLALTSTPDTAGYGYRLHGSEDGAAFTIAAAERAPLEVTAGSLVLRIDGHFTPGTGHDTAVEVRLNGFTLPGQDFAAEAAEVDIALDGELRPATSRFTVGPFQVGGGDPVIAPLSLAGRLTRAGSGYDVTAELQLADDATPLADISARYADSGEARVGATSRELTFSPDELQPARISPLLESLEEVSGNLSATASFAWPRIPAQEQARITLNGISFSTPVTVEGLDLTLVLDRLLPPASPAGQRLTISRLEAGVPVENIAVDFSLDPRPRLDIADGGFDLGGARWFIEPAALDPTEQEHRVVLGTEALDLSTFFRLIEVDGLDGSGTLKGRVPIVFAGSDVIVDDGHFEAQGPGRLSIRFEALRSALAGGGETVEMAARALEDFHYENLSLSLDKTADNDATLRLSTLGQNPEVLDGQPFQFNINLESNLTSVLEALRQGYSLSDDALRRAWELRD